VILPADRKLARLPITRVHTGPNARTKFLSDTLDELGESIRRLGQQVPLIVYPHNELPGDWLTADGNRRLLAMRRIGSAEVEAVTLSAMPDPTDLVIIQASLGATNEKLSPYDLADACQKIKVGRPALSQEDIAGLIGISPSKLSKCLTINEDLAPELRADVEAGLLPFSIAACIARLKGVRDQQCELARAVKADLLGRKGVEEAVNRLLDAGSKQSKKSSPVEVVDGDATARFPSSWTWDQIAQWFSKVVEAAKRGSKMPGAPTAYLQGLLKSA
jgi:ParB/RepB/Spo0J family partition protein